MAAQWQSNPDRGDRYRVYAELWSGKQHADRRNFYGLWVVRYKIDDTIWIVDGYEGACGEEPKVAGPFETIEQALSVAEMMMVMNLP
jgi:hypothetical protein